MSKHFISFDLKADFAFFKKPDVNDGLVLSYNSLHKPALLGILGAIGGLSGYQKKGVFPEYYQLLKNLPVGIEPLAPYHDKGNFNKTIIKYTNTTGYANADGNLLITEQTLISPAYRIYLLLDNEKDIEKLLYHQIKDGNARYLPYLGKNEYAAWWNGEDVIEYGDYVKVESISNNYSVSSVFMKSFKLNDPKVKGDEDLGFFDIEINPDIFFYFERLPIGFDEKLFQYELMDFSFSNVSIKADFVIDSLYKINGDKYVQLF